MRRRRNAHRQHIHGAGPNHLCHVKHATNERPLDRPNPLPVQPDFRRVVDSLKRQRQLLPLPICRRLEFAAIPVILLVQTFRNRQVVQSVLGIWVNALIDHRRQHGARYRSVPPTNRSKSILRDCVAVCRNLRRRPQLPPSRNHPFIRTLRFDSRVRFAPGFFLRPRKRRIRFRHRVWILGRPVTRLGLRLHWPRFRPFLINNRREIHRLRAHLFDFIAGQCTSQQCQSGNLSRKVPVLLRRKLRGCNHQ